MKSSFQRGRSTASSMTAGAKIPENQAATGSNQAPASPDFRDAGLLEKDATKRDPRALGAALRFYRGKRSQVSVARDAHTKRSDLAAYEDGEKALPPATFRRLTEALGVPASAICTLADLLSVNPAFLEGTAEPADFRSLETATRQIDLFRNAEPALLPFAVGRRASRLPDDRDAPEAASLWACLRPYSPAERWAIVQENQDFHSWALSRFLCDESIEAAADDPAEALALAQLGEQIAPLVAGSDALRSRRTGYCAFHVGSAIRAGGSLPAADENLQRAETLWNAGASPVAGERFGEARVLGLKASLRRDQRLFKEALDLLEEALSLDSEGLRAHLLINRAKTFEEMGSYEEAIATLLQAATHIDADSAPRLLLIQRFNLNVNFCRLGRYADADRWLGEMEELAQKVAKGVARIRIAWLHGWIAAGMGRLEEAEAALGAVRDELLVRNIGYDAALASLDLAKLYLQQGRPAEVKHLAGQMVGVFQQQGVHREAVAAAQLFQEAADRERVSVELVSRLADFLRRARHDAELRFTG